ncbi:MULTISPECIES: hypothetical protein [unclassified Thermosynechococcus]|uniref:hypothetical protein n=1 Tax=unclassified Thermosynechococcus TaxID=2622553 RepID=UPI00197F1F09|nr:MULTISPECIES: hypothetical protein [unclassified Thermosynechococcus]MDR5639761.1 hypothetical protein [Thermosynechococcus sp. PP42]MDR7898842.1 hypothetical protein [Thermosynechococcus sp. JY1332]MDR7906247.1 hypothetical protein [Thermosynechococcus sp. JY1334]MDR7921574.1 hypothetical protein [Thermosynechococcus sp. HY213]MDR7994067.1 hypothetical protein [Thermosynechococcus sp. TG252]
MTKLLPVTAYTIRRLLRQYQGQLKSVVVEGACLVADPEADLNAVLESLYLDEEEVCTQVAEIEKLMMTHQLLLKAGAKEQAAAIEDQILWIFGLKRIKNQATQEAAPAMPIMMAVGI